MGTFNDIVGQNWFRIARLGTPLQQTEVKRGSLPRWPQLSRVAWARENVSVCQVKNRRCPATLVGEYVLASFNKVMLCMILAGCAGGTVLPAAL